MTEGRTRTGARPLSPFPFESSPASLEGEFKTGECDTSQDVCPYNIKFAQALKVPEFAPRAVIAGKDASTLARELLAMSQSEFSVVFKDSAMKRAKLRGLKRNAAIVLGNAADRSAVTSLSGALSDDESLVREHAAWALGRIGSPAALEALLARAGVEVESRVVAALQLAIASLGD